MALLIREIAPAQLVHAVTLSGRTIFQQILRLVDQSLGGSCLFQLSLHQTGGQCADFSALADCDWNLEWIEREAASPVGGTAGCEEQTVAGTSQSLIPGGDQLLLLLDRIGQLNGLFQQEGIHPFTLNIGSLLRQGREGEIAVAEVAQPFSQCREVINV